MISGCNQSQQQFVLPHACSLSSMHDVSINTLLRKDHILFPLFGPMTASLKLTPLLCSVQVQNPSPPLFPPLKSEKTFPHAQDTPPPRNLTTTFPRNTHSSKLQSNHSWTREETPAKITPSIKAPPHRKTVELQMPPLESTENAGNKCPESSSTHRQPALDRRIKP